MIPEQSRALAYLQKKGTLAPAIRLREQWREAAAAIESALDDVASEQRDLRPAAGKWSAHDILDHLVVSHEPAVTQLASCSKASAFRMRFPRDCAATPVHRGTSYARE
jgi:hypothetical protein